MNINLNNPELESYIKGKVDAGEYASADELIVSQIQKAKDDEVYEVWLNAELQKGEDAIKRGDYEDGEVVMARLKAELEQKYG